MADLLGEFLFRFFGQIILELFMFRVCRFVGWVILKIVTFGTYPAGMWKEQKELGWVSWFGLSVIVGIIAWVLISTASITW